MDVLYWTSFGFFFAGVVTLLGAKYFWWQTEPETYGSSDAHDRRPVDAETARSDWEASTVDLAYLREFVQRYQAGAERAGTLSGSVN